MRNSRPASATTRAFTFYTCAARTNRSMTSSNRTPATVSSTLPTPSASRKSLTLLQFLALMAFGGIAASLVLRHLV
jgi:hypothetical protein